MELKRAHWNREDYQEFGGILLSHGDEGFAEFDRRGIPVERPILGVRTPAMRKMAREIVRGNWQEFLDFEPVSFEELTIRGFVIGLLPYNEMRARLGKFLPLIDNWATCDMFCATLKSVKQRREDFLEVILPMLKGGEFEVRTGLVLLLDYYVDFDYLQVIFEQVDKVKEREEYYVRMAVAWLLCECYVKYPDETYLYLKQNSLPDWILRKTISKINDSYRVMPEEKELIKELR